LLLGLSCAGDFEIETAYFDNTDTIAEGSPFIAGTSALAGSLDLGTLANSGAAIVGFATRGGRHDTTKTNSEGGTIAGPNYTVTLVTRWIPVTS
jgi:hypothetical protein